MIGSESGLVREHQEGKFLLDQFHLVYFQAQNLMYEQCL